MEGHRTLGRSRRLGRTLFGRVVFASAFFGRALSGRAPGCGVKSAIAGGLLAGLVCIVLGGAFAPSASAQEGSPDRSATGVASDDLIERLGSTSRKQIREAILELAEIGDRAALPALRALLAKELYVDGEGRLYAPDPTSGARVSLTRGAGEPAGDRELREPRINNAVRRVLQPVIARFELRDPDPDTRMAAAQALAERPKEEFIPAVESALDSETRSDIRDVLTLVLAQLRLESADPARRLAAVRAIGESGDTGLAAQLEPLVEVREDGSFAEPDARVRDEAEGVLAAFARKRFMTDAAQHLFYGISLGSVLLLAAMGLAVTFGLMGVINMAHGEMLMLGAYSTYTVQTLFQSYLPGALDLYLLASVPVAFMFTAAVGMALERGILRFLYGRPLETLLTTQGISLVLIQTIRLSYGASNVSVANPSWLSGGVEVFAGVVFPYARLATVVFAGAVLAFVWYLLQRTRLGLQVRAVTQNRPMAKAMGISTDRVDMWTFGLGSGIAGLGGVALSQLGNVGPELGQAYIVDSFMVVVLGGVGKLAGTIAGAFGLGIVNKLLEPVSGAVLGKIAVLVFVIIFIQRRPEGMFALRGRAAEA